MGRNTQDRSSATRFLSNLCATVSHIWLTRSSTRTEFGWEAMGLGSLATMENSYMAALTVKDLSYLTMEIPTKALLRMEWYA